MASIHTYTPEQLSEIVTAYECKIFSLRRKRNKLQETNKQLMGNNPDYNKGYYEQHKHERVRCNVCDMELNRYALATHKSSKRHLLISCLQMTAQIGPNDPIGPVSL